LLATWHINIFGDRFKTSTVVFQAMTRTIMRGMVAAALLACGVTADAQQGSKTNPKGGKVLTVGVIGGQ
jgi:hypothetical protein